MEALATLSFDQALTELESVVQRLEGGPLPLEETVALYQRGRALAEHCQRLLDAAELQVSQLAPEGIGPLDTDDELAVGDEHG